MRRVLVIIGFLFCVWLWQNPQQFRAAWGVVLGWRDEAAQKWAIASQPPTQPSPQSPRPIPAQSPAVSVLPIQRVQFSPGAIGITLTGQHPDGIQPYGLGCRAGQVLSLTVQQGDPEVWVLRPDSTVLLRGEGTAQLPQDGEYRVLVRARNFYALRVEVN